MKIITLNCQKAYNPNLKDFFVKIFNEEKYDFILLQEVNESVSHIIQELNSTYKILNEFNHDFSENSQVCILCKEKYVLDEIRFVSFGKFDPKRISKSFGLIIGVFNIKNTYYVISSLHLNSGLNSRIRMQELKKVKEVLQEYIDKGSSVIIAGDFNTGIIGEIKKCEKILSPQLVRASERLGPTLNSLYTEPNRFILSHASVLLSKFGIGIKLRADHIYVSEYLTLKHKLCCKILPDRVSDHSAIECEFKLGTAL